MNTIILDVNSFVLQCGRVGLPPVRKGPRMWPPPVRWAPRSRPPLRSRTPEVRLHVVVRARPGQPLRGGGVGRSRGRAARPPRSTPLRGATVSSSLVAPRAASGVGWGSAEGWRCPRPPPGGDALVVDGSLSVERADRFEAGRFNTWSAGTERRTQYDLVAPRLSARCPPIWLIGVRSVLSVAGWWVTVVSAVQDQPSGWSGPTSTGRDAPVGFLVSASDARVGVTSLWIISSSCSSEYIDMKALIGLLLLVFGHGVSSVLHSLHYFYTGSSGLTTFPEFVAVGMVDGVQFNYYDSNTQKKVLKQDWMEQLTREDPDYLERDTRISQGHQQAFKANIGIAKQRFNQTGGAHMVQWMYGCEWDDDDDSTDGYNQYGYDGEDFISLDLKTLTWVAPVRQAVTTKHKWDGLRAYNEYWKNYHTKECVDWLKKYLSYGKSSLQRTACQREGLFPSLVPHAGTEVRSRVPRLLDSSNGAFFSRPLRAVVDGGGNWGIECPGRRVGGCYVRGCEEGRYAPNLMFSIERPRVSLLQRSPSSPVVCHATGFYPDRVVVFWRRDGQELHEQVDPGEVLPNHDGTFQVSVDLNLTTVPQEDWGRYECVVQLRGIEDISTPLDPALIRTNSGKSGLTIPIIIGLLVLLLAAAAAVVGVLLYKKRNASDKRHKPVGSDTSSENTEGQNPAPEAQPLTTG
ncbi:unnamed protein product [Boreogadus saida]